MVWAAELIGPGGPCAFPHGRWLWGCQNLVAPSGRPANTRSKFRHRRAASKRSLRHGWRCRVPSCGQRFVIVMISSNGRLGSSVFQSATKIALSKGGSAPAKQIASRLSYAASKGLQHALNHDVCLMRGPESRRISRVEQKRIELFTGPLVLRWAPT